mgnify:CR=1 FL=1
MEGDSVSTPTKEALRDYFATMVDTELTVNVNETELAEFLQEISDEVQAEARLSKARTIVEAAASLVVTSTTKTFEQLRLKMYKCLEKPGFVSSGYFLKNDFDAWGG